MIFSDVSIMKAISWSEITSLAPLCAVDNWPGALGWHFSACTGDLVIAESLARMFEKNGYGVKKREKYCLEGIVLCPGIP